MQKVGQNVVCDTGDVSPGQFSDHKQGESDLLIRCDSHQDLGTADLQTGIIMTLT